MMILLSALTVVLAILGSVALVFRHNENMRRLTLGHEREVLSLQEQVRQAEHKRSIELTEALRDPDPLELATRQAHAQAALISAETRHAEAEAGRIREQRELEHEREFWK